MKPSETTKNAPIAKTPTKDSRAATYQKVRDARKLPIRGLCVRNGHYYARLSVEDPTSGRKAMRRVPLVATTVPEATMELNRLKLKRKENNLPVLQRTPKFSDYVDTYLAYFETVKDAKRPKTMQTERGHLKQWVTHMGDTRLDKINRSMINGFIAKRQGEKVSGRTVNLAVTILRNVLNRAIDDHWIQRLPTENLRPLSWTPRKRALTTLKDLNKLCDAAVEVSQNGVEFSQYIKLMGFCGSRMSETFRLKWSDVDWERQQITIGSDGLAKNHKARVVDFNPALAAHLKEMFENRAPDSEFLFPSPQRGKNDKAAKSFRETLMMARKEAGLNHFGFHDCRHFFISYAVMSGNDFMTIARFVGHSDGGILIGKVYGHLSNDHTKAQAQKIRFEPVVIKAETEQVRVRRKQR